MLSRDDVLEQMRQRVHHPAGTRELLQLLQVPREERATFRRLLKALVADGDLPSELSVTLAAAGGVVETAHGLDEVLRLLPEAAYDALVLSPSYTTDAVAEATDRLGRHPIVAPIRPTEPPAALVRRLNRAVRRHA